MINLASVYFLSQTVTDFTPQKMSCLLNTSLKSLTFKQNFYVVDVRQSLHFKQVFKVLEKIGFEQHQNCHHIEYDFVETPGGAMSSRKGNIIPLIDLVNQMESMVKENYLEKISW